MLNLEWIAQCTIIGCVCLGPKVGEAILHGSSQWDSCYAITHSLTTLHWRNIGQGLDSMDLQLDWGSFNLSNNVFLPPSIPQTFPKLLLTSHCILMVVRDICGFYMFSFNFHILQITVSHHFANFQWYTILIFGSWHPPALLRKEFFIIFHNRCIFIIAMILLRFQKSVYLRFHKKCSARKRHAKPQSGALAVLLE